MADQEKVRELVDLIKRLQTFNLADGRAVLAKLPPGIISVEAKTFTWRDATYLRAKVSILDPKALRRLDFKQYAPAAPLAALKAGQVLQKMASFEPDVVSEARNVLPKGMIGALPVDPAVVDVNNEFNNNKRKVAEGLYWPIPFEEIKAEL